MPSRATVSLVPLLLCLAGAPAPARPAPPDELARAIVPVRIGAARLDEAWAARRKALRDHDAPGAVAAARALRDAQRELGIVNLPHHATAELREAERALAAGSNDAALAHAELALALAPDLPGPHFLLARAHLTPVPYVVDGLADVVAGTRSLFRAPGVARPLLGDVFAAALLALFAAAASTVLVLFLGRLRLLLHDVTHLPVLRHGTALQAAALALAILLVPLVFRLGAFWVLLAAALASWPYLRRREMATVAVALLAVAALPWLTQVAAQAATWQGTLAGEVEAIEYGAPAPERVMAVEARSQHEPLPAAALEALGRWHKRRGDLATARRWYDAALAADPRSAELPVNLGNVLFLQGDLEGARASYQAALERATAPSTRAAARYGLSRVHLRTAAMAPAAEARRLAQQEDADYLARHGSDDDYRANVWLVDALLPADRIAALARGDDGAREVSAVVRRFLAGPLPAPAWPAAPLVAIAVLGLLAWLAPRLEPSRACDRCGRPACPRCDGLMPTTCGQCANVYFRRNPVEPRDRVRKESEVRRHQRLRRLATRVLAVATGGAGHVLAGQAPLGLVITFAVTFLAALAFAWQGWLPLPLRTGAGMRAWLVATLLVLAVTYGLAVRAAFRRSSEGE